MRPARGSPDILILGYGNELRRDDGVGPRVARLIEALRLPNVRAEARHQLTPEWAEPLSQVRAAIFVDASLAGVPGTAEIRPVAPVAPSPLGGHLSDPGALLALTRAVYHRAPDAWLITVAAQDLGVGEQLSAAGQQGLAAALAGARDLIVRLGFV